MILDDLADYLQTQNIGTVNVDSMPNDPDHFVCLYAQRGQAPEIAVNVDYPAFQLRVRDKDHGTAFADVLQIQGLLHGLTETQIGNSYVHLIVAADNPQNMGMDPFNRWVVLQNYTVIMRRA